MERIQLACENCPCNEPKNYGSRGLNISGSGILHFQRSKYTAEMEGKESVFCWW